MNDNSVPVVTDGDTAPAAPAEHIEGLEVSVEQREALADGRVSEEEYLAGFERFRECVREGGFDLQRVRREGPLMLAEYSHESVEAGVSTACYWQEWQQLDMAWQVGHHEDRQEVEMINYCLEQEGHDAGDSWEETERLFETSGLDRETCVEMWDEVSQSWGTSRGRSH